MKYAQIRSMDISNGPGCRVSIFFQGCNLHCKGCFNSELWDFNGGKEFTEETKELLFKLLDKPYIAGLSILGGEPLNQDIYELTNLVVEVKEKYPDKTIWLYTGYDYKLELSSYSKIFYYVDTVVDGRFNEDLKDSSLAFRGSSNQKIYDVRTGIDVSELYDKSI